MASDYADGYEAGSMAVERLQAENARIVQERDLFSRRFDLVMETNGKLTVVLNETRHERDEAREKQCAQLRAVVAQRDKAEARIAALEAAIRAAMAQSRRKDGAGRPPEEAAWSAVDAALTPGGGRGEA